MLNFEVVRQEVRSKPRVLGDVEYHTETRGIYFRYVFLRFEPGTPEAVRRLRRAAAHNEMITQIEIEERKANIVALAPMPSAEEQSTLSWWLKSGSRDRTRAMLDALDLVVVEDHQP